MENQIIIESGEETAGQPGMVTVGCAALAFGRALNHGWAILATPEIGESHPGWWPDGWDADRACVAKEKVLAHQHAGACLDEILRLDQEWRDLFGAETTVRHRWTAAQSGLVYESESRYTFYAQGAGQCQAWLIVRTSWFGPIHVDLDDGRVRVAMDAGYQDAGYQDFHEVYRNTWLPDQIERYIRGLAGMGAWLLPSACMYLQAKEFVAQNL